MPVLLIGNYGVGNLGDEALKEYFLATFPEVEWQVMSAHPEDGELPRLPGGVRSFIGFSWLKTLKALWHCEAVVFGGGTLFTDAESIKAPLLWGWHVFMARLLCKPVHLAFQGVGPFRTWLGRAVTSYAIKRAASVSVRDELSLEKVRVWKGDALLSFDPVITMVNGDLGMVNDPALGTTTLVVIPRANSNQAFFTALQALTQGSRFEKVRVVSLQPEAEKLVIETIKSRVSQPVEVVEVRTLDALSHAVQGGGLVLAQRYHGALAALAHGCDVQIVPQAAGDKLSAIEKLINSESAHGRKERLLERVNLGNNLLREALRV